MTDKRVTVSLTDRVRDKLNRLCKLTEMAQSPLLNRLLTKEIKREEARAEKDERS